MKTLTSRLPSAAPLCFFLISVAYKLAWTAISSLLSQYSKAFGPRILLQLNVAYFFPSIPVLMLQTAFNDRMDRRLGLPAGALVRLGVGLGGLVALTRFFPQLTAGSEQALLITTAFVGVSYGVAFGTSYQIASKYSAGSTVALTTGFVSSGPVVLLLDLALKRGAYYTPAQLEELFNWVSWVTALGLLAAAALVLGSWRMLSAGGPVQRLDALSAHRTAPSSYGAGGKNDAGYALHTSERVGGPYVRHRTEPSAVVGSGGSGGWGGAGGGGGGGGMSGPGGSLAYSGNGLHHLHHHHQPGSHHAITLDFSAVGGGAAGSTDNYLNHNHHNHRGNGTDAGKAPYQQYDVSVATGSVFEQADLSADESKVAKRDLSFTRLALRVAPAALAISISVGTSMLIFPFFTYMRSTGLLGVRLAQVLFYIRLVGDIAGRMVPRRLQVTTVRKLMLWALVKLALVPVLFGCIFTPEMMGGDLTSMVVVAVFWVLSGYLNTCSYLVGPTLVPPGQKGRASGLMTVAFQSACFGALMIAYAIQQLDLGHHAAAVAAAVLAHKQGG